MILPRRLVPKGGIPIRAPVRGQAHARRLRKNGGKLRGDVVIEGHARRIRRNFYVVSSARELELVDRCRTQGRRQLNGETVAGLIPIRGKGWERRITPEVTGRTPVRPRLICIFDEEIHFLADVDVAPNTVLPGLDRLQGRRDPVG